MLYYDPQKNGKEGPKEFQRTNYRTDGPALAISLACADHQEAVRSFLERREPLFKGK